MKFLQNLAVEGDWGRFIHFSEEHFNWKDEVGNASMAKQEERGVFYKKLGKDKQQLQEEIEECGCLEAREMKFDNRLLSIQLAELFEEPTDEWSIKTHKKTFDALNRLTKMGKNVDDPREFNGLTLVIGEDGEIELEGVVESNIQKGKNTQVVGNSVVIDNSTEKAVKVSPDVGGDVEVTHVSEDTGKGPLVSEVEHISRDSAAKIPIGQEDITTIVFPDSPYIKTKEDLTKSLNKKYPLGKRVDTSIDIEEGLTTTVLSSDFLTESTTAEEEKVKLEPAMAKLKKTSEEIKILQDNLDKLDQDFANTKAEIQTALEGSFEKGKLEGKTPAQIEDLIKDDKKYTKLYDGLKSHFEYCRTLESARKGLVAVISVDALYDEAKGYQSRYDVKEEDVMDAPGTDKTEFAKKYTAAEKALQNAGGVTVENQALFDEMKEGHERARLVVQAKQGMDELATLNEPVAGDFSKIQTIKSQVTEARTHGAINDMFEEGVFIELLQKERRSSHMQAKENAEEAYSDVPEEYRNDLSELTSKKLENPNILGLISILSTAMTHPLNKEKDIEVIKQEGGDENAEVWETKHLDQETANGIESLILRREQLQESQKYSNEFVSSFPRNHNVFAKERQQGKDKKWLSVEDVDNFQKSEITLNNLVTLYSGESGASLLQSDLENQYGSSFITDLVRARENVNFRLNQVDIKNHERVIPKVTIENEKFQFDKLSLETEMEPSDIEYKLDADGPVQSKPAARSDIDIDALDMDEEEPIITSLEIDGDVDEDLEQFLQKNIEAISKDESVGLDITGGPWRAHRVGEDLTINRKGVESKFTVSVDDVGKATLRKLLQ